VLASGGTLRKLLGTDGIEVLTNLTTLLDRSYAGELQISGSALLQAIANLAALVATKQTQISVANPIPSINFVYGLSDALNNAASTGPSAIADITGLTEALAGKQGSLSSSSTLQLSELTCSLLRPAAGQTLRLADADGIEQLGLSSSSALFLRQAIVPSLDCSGSIVCGGSALIGGPLYVGGGKI